MAIGLVVAVLVHTGPKPTVAHRPSSTPATTHPSTAPGPASQRRAQPPESLPLEPDLAARRACPQSATACVDLSDRITWLQSHGRIDFGPVQMEPGTGKQPTPVGTFHVSWKGGPHYISTSYRVPIPWPVFFATGGIAFHAGSLHAQSHGCVHLRMASARYYHDHLPVGAKVVVFASARAPSGPAASR